MLVRLECFVDAPLRLLPISFSMKLHLTSLLVFSLVSLSSFVSAEEASVYPLKTCVVSGEKLGGMGKPYVFAHEGREVQFCCKGCLKDFNKNPKKYLAKLDAAAPVAK